MYILVFKYCQVVNTGLVVAAVGRSSLSPVRVPKFFILLYTLLLYDCSKVSTLKLGIQQYSLTTTSCLGKENEQSNLYSTQCRPQNIWHGNEPIQNGHAVGTPKAPIERVGEHGRDVNGGGTLRLQNGPNGR